jgi:hypothetical protein
VELVAWGGAPRITGGALDGGLGTAVLHLLCMASTTPVHLVRTTGMTTVVVHYRDDSSGATAAVPKYL